MYSERRPKGPSLNIPPPPEVGTGTRESRAARGELVVEAVRPLVIDEAVLYGLYRGLHQNIRQLMQPGPRGVRYSLLDPDRLNFTLLPVGAIKRFAAAKNCNPIVIRDMALRAAQSVEPVEDQHHAVAFAMASGRTVNSFIRLSVLSPQLKAEHEAAIEAINSLPNAHRADPNLHIDPFPVGVDFGIIYGKHYPSRTAVIRNTFLEHLPIGTPLEFGPLQPIEYAPNERNGG